MYLREVAMRALLIILGAALISGFPQLLAQGHIAPCNGSSDHTGGICYGYATGRAAGRLAGDAHCNPLTLYQSTINTNFFDFIAEGNLTGLQPGDIVRFADHAAYVVSVGNPVGQSRVDQYSTMRNREETNLLLDDVKREFGNWTGYYRKKQVSITVRNSFDGGLVKIDGAQVNAGTYPVNWWGSLTLEVVDRQNILDPNNNTYYVRVFRGDWTTPDGTRSGLSIGITPKPSQTYTANFNKEFNITFQNSLPGASGGQIKVNGTTYTAPYVAHTLENNPPQSITGEALYQVINRIEYTFSSWSPGGSTSANTVFTPTDHTTYTANFNAKPLWPENVTAGGAVGEPVHITWTEHPHPSVTQYQIWRIIKPQGARQGDPQLLETVSRGTTSFTDYSCIITETYTHDLVSYDVRAYFSVNGSYSDPNYVSVFANSVLPKRAEDGKRSKTIVPSEYSISNFPNPFNPSTTFSYQLVEPALVRLQIFDVLGRQVAEVVNSDKPAGSHTAVWNGRDQGGALLPSGMYLYQFLATRERSNVLFRHSGKVLLTK